MPNNKIQILKTLLGGSLVCSMSTLAFTAGPIIMTQQWGNEFLAGIFIGLLSLLQALFFDPSAGRLADQIGVITLMRYALITNIFVGILWWSVPNVYTLLIFFIGLYIYFGFFVTNAYLIRRTPADQGGFWFGLKESLYALAGFLGVFCLPIITLREFEWSIIGLFLAGVSFIALVLLMTDKSLKGKKPPSKSLSWNPLTSIKNGFAFVQKNHQVPYLVIGALLFQGFFFGFIYFLFPLYIFELYNSSQVSLSLSIYEIVTLISAAAFGFLADKINWKQLEIYAWTLTICLIWLLPFWYDLSALIVIGAVIGLANSLFNSASFHALNRYNQDHKHDGQFTGLSMFIQNSGYAISPMLAGLLYSQYGYETAMITLAVIITLVGLWMLSLSIRLGRLLKIK